MAGGYKKIEEYKSTVSKEVVKANSAKGGRVTAERRKERKTFAEALKLMLEDDTVQDNLLKAMITKATDGDVSAFTAIRDTIGEKPTDKQQLSVEELPVISIGRAKKND